MTAKLELVSLKEHAFGGKLRKKGDKIQATVREARLLKALGRAVPAEQVPPPAPVVEVTPRRAYKRRDMQAESLDNIPPAPVAERQSLVSEVDKVRDGYRATFGGASALGSKPETLHITKPKKSAA